MYSKSDVVNLCTLSLPFLLGGGMGAKPPYKSHAYFSPCQIAYDPLPLSFKNFCLHKWGYGGLPPYKSHAYFFPCQIAYDPLPLAPSWGLGGGAPILVIGRSPTTARRTATWRSRKKPEWRAPPDKPRRGSRRAGEPNGATGGSH